MPAPKQPQDHKLATAKDEAWVPDPRGRVDGKAFVWTTEDGVELSIPLRLKMKILRSTKTDSMDAAGMFAMLEMLIPDQIDVMDEMDVNDFTAAFGEWQNAYNDHTGATLGESSDSST